MAKNIIAKGNLDSPLAVYNRTQDRAVAFSKEVPADKVGIAAGIAEGVAAAEVIFTMLADDKAVEAVFSQALVPSAKPQGKLFIDSSTVHPDTSKRLAAAAEAQGAAFVAAPVFGAPAMADLGQLVGVLSGPSAAVDRARPYFQGVTARAEILMRDVPVGQAPLLKLIGNTFIMNMVEQLAEGHVLVEKAGVDNSHLQHLVELVFPGIYPTYSQRMLSGQYYTRDRPLFAVDLARKDLGHALSIAKDCGASVPNTQTVDAHLAKVKEHDGERGDMTAVYGVLRQEAGLPYGNQK